MGEKQRGAIGVTGLSEGFNDRGIKRRKGTRSTSKGVDKKQIERLRVTHFSRVETRR